MGQDEVPPTCAAPQVERRSFLTEPMLLCGFAALAGFTLGVLVSHRPASQSGGRQTTVGTLKSTDVPHLATPAAASMRHDPPAPPMAGNNPLCADFFRAPLPALLPNSLPRTDLSGQPVQLLTPAVACGLLLAAQAPEYPTLASLTQLEGEVSLQIVISPQGTVTVARILDGPPLLRAAAERAVRQWRFRPYTRNGRVLEAEARVALPVRPQAPHLQGSAASLP